MSLSRADRKIVSDLAKRVAEIAASPEMQDRRGRWREHNSLRSAHPMVLVFPEGSWQEILPDSSLRCEDSAVRDIECELRKRIYAHEHFAADNVVDPTWAVPKAIGNTGWGIEAKHIASDDARGAWHFDPVIVTPDDLRRLRHPEVTYDEADSLRRQAVAAEAIGDVLPVTLDGIKCISYHLMNQYTAWRGLEEVMVDMYAEPQMLHEAMAFLEEGHRRILRQYVDLGLLQFNNDNTYHNSGGNGFTDELPLADADPRRVRPCDLWGSAEAQEMAQVSPEQHAEFIMQYEKRLLEPFGLTGYGCCEDLTRKLDDVLTIPHLRRISISPWADVDACAEKLAGRRAVFSWKPNPAQLVGAFDANAIRACIRRTVEVAKAHDCVLEIILKDTHTCESHPERFDRWSQIAREVIAEVWGGASAAPAPATPRGSGGSPA